MTIVTSVGRSVPGALLRRMTRTLNHRGPDDVGFAWVDPSSGAIQTAGHLAADTRLSGVLFGHCRLSILDLTPAGHQPMVSDDGRSVLSFNGEIYNFLELREELRALGVTFRGRGDTEVLLKAYEQWGPGALNRFNGMWAFVLWDGRQRRLLASRDRFGVKPLYYLRLDGTWIFASEIKGVLAYPGAFQGVNDRAVLEYLIEGRVDHNDDTMFRGIRSLPAASYLELSGARSTLRKFWTLPSQPSNQPKSEPELLNEFEGLLADSVRLRGRSDVPIGTMMSGGLDSTAITALIREQQQCDRPGVPIFEGLQSFHQTFSACWPDSDHDEESEIDLMTSALGLVSYKVYPTAEMVEEILPTVTYHLEEPFPDPIAAVQYLLMREARGHGVKVVLNGHGSDETLAGYHDHFVPPFLAGLLLHGRLPSFFGEQRAFRSAEWGWPQVAKHVLLLLVPAPLRSHAITHARSIQLRRGHGLFTRTQSPSQPGESALESIPSSLTPINAALWRKFSEQVLPAWLRMEDRMSMASSVESRLPFLDYRLVEFAFQLPDSLKLRDGYTKYILRQAMRDRLPERVVLARAKHRFTAPYGRWFREAWRPMISDLLLGDSAVAPYLDRRSFRARLEAYMEGADRPLSARILWRVLSAELWLGMVRNKWGGVGFDHNLLSLC